MHQEGVGFRVSPEVLKTFPLNMSAPEWIRTPTF
jgi:hypothetical protein